MTDLETRLREVVFAEPPLGFDPDDVVTKAAKRQRNRRATVATVVLTLGIAGAAVVALRPSPPPPAAPPAPTYPPPVIIVKPSPRNPLEQRTLDHLKEALPEVLAGARKILISGFYSMGGELHPDELTATVSFLDREGKGHSFNLGLIGRLTVSRNMVPVAQTCAVQRGSRCDKRADGSTVVLSARSAVHYRADGTAVDVNDVGKLYPDDAPPLGLPAGPGAAPFADGVTFDERQLIALVTDPGFAAQ